MTTLMVNTLSYKKVPSLLAAALLAMLGLLSMHQEHQKQTPYVSGAWSGVKDVASRLAEREATLKRRIEAEELLLSFTRAQMTRYYWGEFASSMNELGISVGEPFIAKLERSRSDTMLWLRPEHGVEAYLAIVRRDSSGTQLETLHCRGNLSQLGQPFSGTCPDGWDQFLPRDNS
ncbi:MAG TPA: thymidylate synthase [Prochlorococcus sp.]|nr:thymidylate synthase [Prochlorococcaceae cyanobacterium ETNP18_MAG_14]